MLEKIPCRAELMALLGKNLCNIWDKLCAAIDEKYEIECIWDSGYRDWVYEYKYRRGGKTLCALYAKENVFGCQVIFGKAEREKLEVRRDEFSPEKMTVCDEAHTYHDGKWVMFMPDSETCIPELVKILSIKRRTNRK